MVGEGEMTGLGQRWMWWLEGDAIMEIQVANFCIFNVFEPGNRSARFSNRQMSIVAQQLMMFNRSNARLSTIPTTHKLWYYCNCVHFGSNLFYRN